MRWPVKLIILMLFIAGCSVKPEAIRYGKDACDFCRMTIIEPKFGGEIVTKKGKVHKFDAVECLANYYKAHLPEANNFEIILVADYSASGKMLDARKAVFLQDNNIGSPMGANLATFPDRETAEKMNISKQGKIMDWNEMLKIVQ